MSAPFISNRAYLYFGTATGYATTPSVTFTSANSLFGLSVADAGDLDGDGLDDIAMSSPADGDGKVFIFSRKNPPASWGTTTSWPATLTDAQANYVISGDPGSNGNLFGWPIAPVGSFAAMGSHDLAIASQFYGGVGRVVIVKSSPSRFGSFTLPDATKTIVIDDGAGRILWGNTPSAWDPHSAPPGALRSGLLAPILCTGSGEWLRDHSAATGTPNDSLVNSPAGSNFGYSFGFLGALGTSPFALAILCARVRDPIRRPLSWH